MEPSPLASEIEAEKRRNLRDTIRHAKWEAEMVKKLGTEWFRIRDEWLVKSYEADKKMWENPIVWEALIKAVLLRDKLRIRKRRNQS